MDPPPLRKKRQAREKTRSIYSQKHIRLLTALLEKSESSPHPQPK